MAIQHRRGSFSDFDASKMLPGEFAFSTDTSEVYYCFSPGNVKRVASREELIEFIETTEEAYIVMQELKGVVAEGKTVDEALSIVINNANTTKDNLDDSINLGNILKDWLDLNIATGTALNDNLVVNVAKGEGLEISLPPLITSANTSKTNLDNTIQEANTSRDTLDTTITTATTTNGTLNTTVNEATTIKNTLDNEADGTIKKASDINNELNITKSDANVINTDLQETTTTANTSKSDLDSSISTANTTKTALDESITDGTVLKDDLNTIITGTNYELLITDVASLKTNKADKTYVDSEIVRVEGKVDNIDIPDPTWENLQNKPNDLETTGGAQTKADKAETNAKTYTDTELSNFEGMSIHDNEYHSVPYAKESDLTTHLAETTQQAHLPKNVGLSNVDNLKQMPISNGVLENYREKLTTLSGTTTAIDLLLGNVFTHSLTGNTTYSITNAVNGQAHSFTLIITQPSTVSILTFPTSVKWQGGEIPDLSNASKTYVLTFMTVDGGTTWLGMFGGEF